MTPAVATSISAAMFHSGLLGSASYLRGILCAARLIGDIVIPALIWMETLRSLRRLGSGALSALTSVRVDGCLSLFIWQLARIEQVKKLRWLA